MTLLIHPTREAWLTAAGEALRPWFADLGKPVVSPVRMSMGFPSTRALSIKKRRIGECWAVEASSDGHAEILVSPMLDDPLEILGVVAHELGHAVLGPKVGHRAPFARLMKELGLEGRATQTVPGPLFVDRGRSILENLGDLPHARLDPGLRPVKKDGTRQLKCECSVCGYVCRTTQKWLDAGGPPICPTCRDTMVHESGEA